jgi:hypothetical protein
MAYNFNGIEVYRVMDTFAGRELARVGLAYGEYDPIEIGKLMDGMRDLAIEQSQTLPHPFQYAIQVLCYDFASASDEWRN